LHGYGSCKESFFYQVECFAKNYRVTVPDIVGFGKSAPCERAYTVGDYADWLCDFMAECRLNSPYIVAHSFGARVILKALSSNASLATKLVLTGGAGIVKERSTQYMRQVKAYRRCKKFFPRYAERHFGSEEYRKLSPMQRQSYRAIVNEDLQDLAKKVNLPTLLIYGREDRVTPFYEEGAIFHRAISGSVLTTLDGGHFCFSEYPEAFNALVTSFLKE
jgi:pimeloyl-ACP methyl ester carboxylesterase